MKKLLILITIILTIVMIFFQFSDITKEYHDTIHGIRYKLGNTTYGEDIEIKIEGKFIKKRFNNINFTGKIILDENILHCSEFDDNNMALLYYDNNGYVETYGEIYINDKLDKFTITQKDWSSKDGIMISVPAKNRKEAVEVHSITMNKFMKDFKIKEKI